MDAYASLSETCHDLIMKAYTGSSLFLIMLDLSCAAVPFQLHLMVIIKILRVLFLPMVMT